MLRAAAHQLAAALRSALLHERLERAQLRRRRGAQGGARRARRRAPRSARRRSSSAARRSGAGWSWPRRELSALRYAATLHDIGELGVPEAILNKPGPLTEEERPAVEQHPLIGEGILSPIEFLADALPLVRAAHERWDGSGYPDGLAGEQIPLGRAHPVRVRLPTRR